MPKHPIDLSNVFFYEIVCKDLTITDRYVGSTTNLVKRRYNHKSVCINENNIHHNTYVYQFIRKNGGWNNWEVIEIERRECIDKNDVLKRERYWLEERVATLNKQLPSRTIEEYRVNNKEIIYGSQKKYINNSPLILCACGGKYKKYGKSQHNNTQMHLVYSYPISNT